MDTDSVMPVATAVVGAVVSIVTARITSQTQVAIARINAPPKDGTGDSTARVEPHSPQQNTNALTRQRNVSLAALVCGVVLLAWGVYSFFEIRTLNLQITSKEQQFQLLRKSFDKVTGITFNPIDVKAVYKVDDDTRDYSLWIEGDDEVLNDIDHVKYIFDDESWKKDMRVMHGYNRDCPGGKHFECELYSPQSLTYVTVLVMYKGYTTSGKIQPINFKWRDEETKIE